MAVHFTLKREFVEPSGLSGHGELDIASEPELHFKCLMLKFLN